jgi:DeoR/GlpR family transcriptional regulator of sugar metabolism
MAASIAAMAARCRHGRTPWKIPACVRKRNYTAKEKMHIAAANMVRDGQVVILDSGTITTAIASALRKFQSLTIITNALNIAAEPSGAPLEVILTGGTLRKNSFSLVGPIAEETLVPPERRHPYFWPSTDSMFIMD